MIDLVQAGVSDAFLESAAGLIAGQVTSPPSHVSSSSLLRSSLELSYTKVYEP